MSAEDGRLLDVNANNSRVNDGLPTEVVSEAGLGAGVGQGNVTDLVPGKQTTVPPQDEAWKIRQTIVRAMQMKPTAVEAYEKEKPIYFKG